MSDYYERLDRAQTRAGGGPDDHEARLPGVWNRRFRAALAEEGLELRSAVAHSDLDLLANGWVWAPLPLGDEDGWDRYTFIADLRG